MRHCFVLRPSYTYLDLFRTQNMRKITILITILYMLIALEFDTTVRNISNLNFNIYMSFMISGALELPADLLSIVGLKSEPSWQTMVIIHFSLCLWHHNTTLCLAGR